MALEQVRERLQKSELRISHIGPVNLRALEVFEITGEPLTQLQKEQKTKALDYQTINIAIIPEDRKILHKKIEQRFKLMQESGLIEEVRSLFKRKDLHKDLPAIRSVGYRQVWEFLEGLVDHEEMQQKAIAATRQLAKRQITWLKKWPNLHIVKDNNLKTILELLAL